MYGFVDFNEIGTNSTLLSIQTNYNGLNLDELLTDETGSFITLTVSGRSNMRNRINTIEVSGLDGLIESEGHTSDSREIEVKYRITDKTNEGFRDRYNRLNDMLSGSKRELSFTDEDAIFYATLSESDVPEENSNSLVGTITFLCSDPYKYGPEKTATFPSDAVTLTNEGTAETDPIITCKISHDTTYVAVSDGKKMNLVGNPLKQEETSFEPETPIFIHGANTLTGWTDSSSVSAEGADQTGVLKTNGSSFYTDQYGTSPNWHGPAMKTSLAEPLQDFRFDTGFSMKKTGNNQAGSIEVSLLDSSSRLVARIFMTKHFGSLDRLSGRVVAGSGSATNDVMREGLADYQRSFDGVIRVYRRGKQWTGQVFFLVDGAFLSPVTHRWIDDNAIANTPVTQVQVRLLQRADFPVVEQKINDIQVYKLNDPSENQIPIIARFGDTLEFNHQIDIIRLNGEDITKEKAFIGDYFCLKPGNNAIGVEPAGAIQETEVRWNPKWR